MLDRLLLPTTGYGRDTELEIAPVNMAIEIVLPGHAYAASDHARCQKMRL